MKRTVVVIGAGANADFRRAKKNEVMAEIFMQSGQHPEQIVKRPSEDLASIAMPTGEQLVKKIANRDEVARNFYHSFFQKISNFEESEKLKYASATHEFLFGQEGLLISGRGVVNNEKSDFERNYVNSQGTLTQLALRYGVNSELLSSSIFQIFHSIGDPLYENSLTLREDKLIELILKCVEFKSYFDLSEIVAYYQPFSIDELLNSIAQDKISIKIHDHLTTDKEKLIEAGKVLIAMFLLQAEDEEVFQNFESIYWYRHLRNAIITSGNNVDEIREKLRNLTIISFNYDRSLDYFLRTKLSEFYENINVVYPYGKLANEADWNEKNYTEIPYGYFKNSNVAEGVGERREKIFRASEKAAKNIKIIGELVIRDENEDLNQHHKRLYSTDEENSSKKIPSAMTDAEKIYFLGEENSLKKILSAMTNAEKIYFLGFGFHAENCAVLLLRNLLRDNTYFYYTNFGGSKKIDGVIADVLRGCSMLEGKTKFSSNKGVHDALMQDFNLSLD